MKKQKKFDCVQMKWDIQKKIAQEFAGASDEEINYAQMERIAQNTLLGPFLHKVRLLQRPEAKRITPTDTSIKKASYCDRRGTYWAGGQRDRR